MNAQDINSNCTYATKEELEWLGRWAKDNPNANVVMIGAGPGVMACALLEVSPTIAMTVIDIQSVEYTRAHLQMVGVQSQVMYIIGDSGKIEPLSNDIDLLIVDGDHSYDGVKQDIENWIGHVKQGGIVLFHDYRHNLEGTPTGVRRAVIECLPDNFVDVEYLGLSRIVKRE